MKRAVILLGRSGCGKGTTADRLINEKGYTHFVMSDALREAKAEDPAFAEKYNISETVNGGVLVSDEGVMVAFERKFGLLPEHSRLVLDGCIRTGVQAHAVVRFLHERGYSMTAIYVRCSRETAIVRIAGRVAYQKLRGLKVRKDDEDPIAVGQRQDNFEKHIEDILHTVSASYITIHTVDGEKAKDDMLAETSEVCSSI